MTEHDQQRAFARDLVALVDRYAQEFDLDAVAAIGILSMQIRSIQDDLVRRTNNGEGAPEA